LAVNAPVDNVFDVAPETTAKVPTTPEVIDAFSHLIDPTLLLSVNVVSLFQTHRFCSPEIVPATGVETIVNIEGKVYVIGQAPFLTVARNFVSVKRLLAVYVAVVAPVTLVQVAPSSVEDCHWIVPVFPVKDNDPPPAEQIAAPPEIVPATDGTSIKNDLTAEIAVVVQTPLVTITL